MRHSKRKTGLHYAWVVLGVTFVTLIAAASVRSVAGVILEPLEREFGWSRESITLAMSINLLLFGLAGPFLGRLIDRFGPRLIAIATLGLIALGMAGTVWMQQPWHMHWLWGVVVGAGSGGASMVMGAAVAHRWFHARRGLALGILGAAMSAGQLIFTPTVMQITSAAGWRAASLSVAVLVGAMVLPLVLLLMADHPEEMGLQAYGDAAVTGVAPPPDAWVMRNALRRSDFWLLASSFGICGLTSSGLIQIHFIPHGVEHGFSAMTMATSLGVMGAADIFGTIASGWICDRFGKLWPLAAYYLIRGATLFALPFVDSGGTLMVFSVICGLNWLSTVPATSALTADLFGKQNVGTVFGWIFFVHQLGAAVASYGASWLHGLMGNYTLAFMSAGMLALTATLLVLCIRRDRVAFA
ncbi:MAG: MFS transporter [Methylococcaceae bacterium]|nr:MAG: MFS transporter [Methylococcaceae bacterium]